MLEPVCTTAVRTNNFVGFASFNLHLFASTQRATVSSGVKQSVDHTTLSRANENRDWRIFADFGEYFIGLVRPLYADFPVPNVNINNEVFALDSTTISLSINLFTWAEGKYT